ncbi:hypothetical protein HanPSC8_Chr12g0538491 [Helianthus annuus]|nr:hypothetical protein HanPSC8_Chr12g0538491 [Helianthus annuus]
MGPGRHQCTQSLYKVTFSLGQCPYLLGCPSGLNNMGWVISISLSFSPFSFAFFWALSNSSIWAKYNSKLEPSNLISLLLKGFFLIQSPPPFQSPPSKCIGANVRKNVTPLNCFLLMIALYAVLNALLYPNVIG